MSPLHRAPDDEPEQLGSGASTPPGGAATPRPDPTDKRTPGILHNYFAQVRVTFSSSTKSAPSTCPLPPPSTMGSVSVASQGSHDGQNRLKQSAHPPVAPHPPIAEEFDDASFLLPHERLGSVSTHTALDSQQHTYPTPPISPFPSTLSLSKGLLAEDVGAARPTPMAGAPWPYSFTRRPPGLRRHTLTSGPLSSVITKPLVHASHISKPKNSAFPRNPVSPISTLTSTPRHSSASLPHSERKKLTEMVTLLHDQSTPPRTPRTLSQNSRQSRTASPSAKPSISTTLQSDERGELRRESSANNIVRPPKGRLSVSISAGRGLKPSLDPYVVCKFQRNEYISKGPRSDDAKSSDDLASRRLSGGLGGIPMTRSDSGRPMAIPMSSRQNSHRSFSEASDARSGQLITDPVWNHDATL